MESVVFSGVNAIFNGNAGTNDCLVLVIQDQEWEIQSKNINKHARKKYFYLVIAFPIFF